MCFIFIQYCTDKHTFQSHLQAFLSTVIVHCNVFFNLHLNGVHYNLTNQYKISVLNPYPFVYVKIIFTIRVN